MNDQSESLVDDDSLQVNDLNITGLRKDLKGTIYRRACCWLKILAVISGHRKSSGI
ncbi:MAG: hypothetical protein ACFFD4_01065 [Candidatus Odinarchaeota archaeon]